jgi:hypothetical protein
MCIKAHHAKNSHNSRAHPNGFSSVLSMCNCCAEGMRWSYALTYKGLSEFLSTAAHGGGSFRTLRNVHGESAELLQSFHNIQVKKWVETAAAKADTFTQ